MDRQILAILKPAIKQELGLSDTQLGLLLGLAFTVFFATLGIPLGLWADRARRAVLVAGALFLFSGMTALSGLAHGFGSLLLARIGVGIGEAGTNPASHAMIADLYRPEERSRAMGVFALGVHLGLLLGLLLGGLVSHRYGWRVAFLAAGLPGLVLAAATYLTVEEPARPHAEAASARATGGRAGHNGTRDVGGPRAPAPHRGRGADGDAHPRPAELAADLPGPVPRGSGRPQRGGAGADRRAWWRGRDLGRRMAGRSPTGTGSPVAPGCLRSHWRAACPSGWRCTSPRRPGSRWR